MEEYIALVLMAGGYPDFKVLVQIQASKWSKEMVEALLQGGFNSVIGPHEKCVMQRITRVDEGYRAHRHVTFYGWVDKDGQRWNDFYLYVQLPNNDPKQADLAVLAMLQGKGLRLFLGKWCKGISFTKKSETHVQQFESLLIKVQ